jgi:hypothetical protein
MSLRSRVEKLEREGSPNVILGATVAAGVVRDVLTADGISRPAPPGLSAEADLPEGCVVHHYDPDNEIPTLTLGTDGRVYLKQIIGVSEYEFMRGAPCP